MFISPGSPETPNNKFWRQVELYCAFTCGAIGIAFLLKDAYILSHTLADAPRSIVGLQRSTFVGSEYVDLNDGQLRVFRDNILFLISVGFLFIFGRKLLNQYSPDLQSNLNYYVIFGLVFAGYLHGPGILYLIMIVSINYVLTKNLAGLTGFPILI